MMYVPLTPCGCCLITIPLLLQRYCDLVLQPLCSQHLRQRLEILLALRLVLRLVLRLLLRLLLRLVLRLLLLGQLLQLIIEIDSSIQRCPKQTLSHSVFVIVESTHTNSGIFMCTSRLRRLLQAHQEHMLQIIKAFSCNGAILKRLPQF